VCNMVLRDGAIGFTRHRCHTIGGRQVTSCWRTVLFYTDFKSQQADGPPQVAKALFPRCSTPRGSKLKREPGIPNPGPNARPGFRLSNFCSLCTQLAQSWLGPWIFHMLGPLMSVAGPLKPPAAQEPQKSTANCP
jgi:hypothetical protein